MKKYRIKNTDKFFETFHTTVQLWQALWQSNFAWWRIFKTHILSSRQYDKLLETNMFSRDDFELIEEELVVYYKWKKFDLWSDDKEFLLDQIKLWTL